MSNFTINPFLVEDYSANAVNFDGSADWLHNTSDYTGISDGEDGTLSFWIDWNGGDASEMWVLRVGNFLVRRLSSNKLEVQDNGTNLKLTSSTDSVAASGWQHWLVSFQLDVSPVAHMYLNDADDEAGGSTEVNGDIDYTISLNTVGSSGSGGGNLSNADIADVWFNPTYMDITQEIVRRRFIDPDGRPAYLGEDGSEPLGSQPIVFFSGPTADWHTNKGSGGGLTENGALTDGGSSPSD